ncbi:hypothetical protein BGZ54_008206, partial [Gamsiella multidivaricata]
MLVKALALALTVVALVSAQSIPRTPTAAGGCATDFEEMACKGNVDLCCPIIKKGCQEYRKQCTLKGTKSSLIRNKCSPPKPAGCPANTFGCPADY